MNAQARMTVTVLLLAASLSGCGIVFGYKPGQTSADVASDHELAVAAKVLLETDRAFAAKSLEAGAAEAFRLYLDNRPVQLPVEGPPVVGRDTIVQKLAGGPPFILTWEPQYAEVLAPGDWGWSWGEWQAHEPGAGGRRLSEGKYVNLWRKQPDGAWKVRLDMGTQR